MPLKITIQRKFSFIMVGLASLRCLLHLHIVKTQELQNLQNSSNTDSISTITIAEPAIHPIDLIFPPISKFPAHLRKGLDRETVALERCRFWERNPSSRIHFPKILGLRKKYLSSKRRMKSLGRTSILVNCVHLELCAVSFRIYTVRCCVFKSARRQNSVAFVALWSIYRRVFVHILGSVQFILNSATNQLKKKAYVSKI